VKGRKAHDLLSLPRPSDEMQIEAIRFLNAASIFAINNLENVASFCFAENDASDAMSYGFSPLRALDFLAGETSSGRIYEDSGRVYLQLHDHLEDSRECIPWLRLLVKAFSIT
jgi:hypothetical protein